MSINWVMLPASTSTTTKPFTPLPNEQTLHTSTPRIALSLTTPAHFPGKQQQPFSLSSSSGTLYLTSRRLIFLPDAKSRTPQLQSFAAPILNLHDSHVAAPWFGPNVWTALLQPTQGGGIPTPPAGVVEVKFTFKEGGAWDFHTAYERVRERLQQAAEVSGNGQTTGQDAANVNMEDLPAYQEEGDGPLIPPIAVNGVGGSGSGERPGRARAETSTPAEPPPGYEEVQMAGLRDEVERTGRNA